MKGIYKAAALKTVFIVFLLTSCSLVDQLQLMIYIQHKTKQHLRSANIYYSR